LFWEKAPVQRGSPVAAVAKLIREAFSAFAPEKTRRLGFEKEHKRYSVTLHWYFRISCEQSRHAVRVNCATWSSA